VILTKRLNGMGGEGFSNIQHENNYKKTVFIVLLKSVQSYLGFILIIYILSILKLLN
jgi:hypothetical protein